MIPTSSLTGTHQRTYKAIFQHPISRRLEWRAVRLLLGKLGWITQQSNGSLKVTRHGQTLILPPPRTKEVTKEAEIMALRHFLERSEAARASSLSEAPSS